MKLIKSENKVDFTGYSPDSLDGLSATIEKAVIDSASEMVECALEHEEGYQYMAFERKKTTALDPTTICIELPFGAEHKSGPMISVSLAEIVDEFIIMNECGKDGPIEDTEGHVKNFTEALRHLADKIGERI